MPDLKKSRLMMNVEDIVWKDKNLDQKVVLNTKKEREMQQSGKETIM